MNRYYKGKHRLLWAIILFALSILTSGCCVYQLYLYQKYKYIFKPGLLLVPLAILFFCSAIILFQEAAELYKPYRRLLKKNIFIICDNWEIVPVEGKEKYSYLEIDYTDENLRTYHFDSEPFKNNEYNISPRDFIKVYVDINKNTKLYIVDISDKIRR